MTARNFFAAALVIFTLGLSGCGGGGGSDDPGVDFVGAAGSGGSGGTGGTGTGGTGGTGTGGTGGTAGVPGTGIVNSIRFVSATPTVISLSGTGQNETSVVVFEVLDTTGAPVRNQRVVFTLDTAVGGITITPTQATTGTDGIAQTVVQAGTVHTSVRVTARLLDNPATALDESTIPPAQSDALVISTGRADQDSFSMSVGCHNIEGDTLNGNTTSVSIHASDRFNNPVPDNTAIAFTAEGGQVQPQCLTTNGVCSVNFTTANPRTPNHRVTVLATAIGEESFTDLNGDGRYDAGEPFADLAEAFRDDNENSVRDPAIEPFQDFNNNGTFTGASGNFTGVLCDSGCDTAPSLHVRGQQVIIMSGSAAGFSFNPSTVDLSSGPVAVTVLISDNAGQPMPGGSQVQATLSPAAVGTIVSDTSFAHPCTTQNGAFPFTFVLAPPQGATSGASGVFQVRLTTPSGVVSSAAIGVSFSTTPPPPPPPPGTLGSLEFVSAIPTTIGIRGTGLTETSTVTFRARSTTGLALANVPVNFSLSTTVGGIELDPVSDTTDASGEVRTIVRAGTVHTSVRVRAQASPTVFSLSEFLTITTGLPDQNSVSLSFEPVNPEGFNIDNTQVPMLLLAADRFNNPVPDGTAFAFTTEGGAIIGNCQTVNGACSVTWRSQNPRPSNGRSAILVTALGEESFTDTNGDGRFDPGEPFEDLGEAFRDDNENGGYDLGEEFLDFNINGLRDPGDTLFNGALCDGGCSSSSTLHVFGTGVLVMSGTFAEVSTATPSGAGDVTVVGDGRFEIDNGIPTVIIRTRPVTGGTVKVRFVVRDPRDQRMPAGTTINLTNSGGDVTITPPDGYSVSTTSTDASAAGNTYEWTVTDEAFVSGDQLGDLTLTVVPPSGASNKTVVSLGLRLDDAPFIPNAGQCDDGVDNDGDGRIDFGSISPPADAQCASPGDNDESS